MKCSVDSLGRVGWMWVPGGDCTLGPSMPGTPAHWACVLGIFFQFSEVNSRKQSFRHAGSLIFWASHPLSFILWVLLLVVEVHLCLTVCFPLVRTRGRPWLDYPNVRAGGWCSWVSLWRENDHTRKERVYTEEILRAENLSNSNSVWPDMHTDQLWKFIVGQ